MKRVLSIPLVAALALAGDGLAPRSNPSEYPAHASAGKLTVAAEAVSAEQAKKIFGAKIDQAGYLVFEVALYPEPGSEADVSIGDFALRVGVDGSTMRAAEPDVVAAAVIPDPALRPPDTPSKLPVHVEATMGRESGGGYGRPGGVYTDQGVGVGNYPSPPPPPPNIAAKDQARASLDGWLAAKQLPTGRITHPVAGYLYFPKPTGHGRKDGYQLTWLGEAGQARMTVPPAK
jgi:hypothetical protein